MFGYNTLFIYDKMYSLMIIMFSLYFNSLYYVAWFTGLKEGGIILIIFTMSICLLCFFNRGLF